MKNSRMNGLLAMATIINSAALLAIGSAVGGLNVTDVLGYFTSGINNSGNLEVLIDKTAGPYDAWTEDVIIKPQSYGGAGQGKVNIPFNIMFAGNRKAGTVTFANKVPTFTETTDSND